MADKTAVSTASTQSSTKASGGRNPFFLGLVVLTCLVAVITVALYVISDHTASQWLVFTFIALLVTLSVGSLGWRRSEK